MASMKHHVNDMTQHDRHGRPWLSTREVFIIFRPYFQYCSNALPFNLVHFPKGEYPGKLTQREIISEEELSEHLDCLSE